MKTFFQYLKLLGEEVRTPEGRTLTPEELEDYERERSPMYRALLLKDIDSRRRSEGGSSERFVPKTPDRGKGEDKEVGADRFEEEPEPEGLRWRFCREVLGAVMRARSQGYNLSQLKAFMSLVLGGLRNPHSSVEGKFMLDALEGSGDVAEGLRSLEGVLSGMGVRIVAAGARSRFDPRIHDSPYMAAKPNEEVVLKSDLATLGGDVLIKADVIPVNDYSLRWHRDLIDGQPEASFGS